MENIINTASSSTCRYKYLPVIGMCYITLLLLANLTSFKIAQINHIEFPAGLIFFPLTYIFDDILTEVYGYKQSRRIIWTGLFCNILFCLGSKLAIALPPAPYWHLQTAYAQVLNSMPRIILASSIGYLCGEFVNSYLLAKLKIITAGKAYWLRLIGSTTVGVGIDSILFCTVAFAFILPTHVILIIAATQYLIKIAYEILVIPLTYLITSYLKRAEQVDYYDYHTNFNPFSLRLDDKIAKT